MKLRQKSLFVATALAAVAMPTWGARILHFDMVGDGANMLTETVSGAKIRIYGQHGVENVDGAAGDALRFDGYSTYATGAVNTAGALRDAMTVSLWVAPETYPIIRHDERTTDKIILAGTLDDDAKKGWAFMLGSTGKYSFVCYTGGWRVETESAEPLPHYEWSRLVAVVTTEKIDLYRNASLVKTGNSLGTIDDNSRTFFIGKGRDTRQMDGFNLNTFNGLIDDLEVFDTAEDAIGMGALAESPADLSIPESRFADDLLRPRFHGMPGANWTNETHGMTYSDGRYHVFFQKNANGPYMSRLHWGHISSPDLVNWTEEKIALFPDQTFDEKGCWSGCVFTDDEVTNGVPNIIYTGVDYAKAVIALATPNDDGLLEWTKKTSPIINGRPNGLSDDFRDPYFFRNGNDAFIIVGSSKDGVGVTTLHKYIPAAKMWSNTTGDIFFAGKDAASSGTFWEMPNVTPMGDKWLFTTTPQNTSNGVKTLYWTGTIGANGTFQPDAASSAPRGVELISKDGYGLLSPTVYQHNGKTIAMGIVPDKLPGSDNYALGWAHCYSLPREWSLDAQGYLLQKPYEGLRTAREEGGFSRTDFDLNGSMALGDVAGRQLELLGRFTVGTSAFGFKFFKNGSSEAVLKYIPTANMLTIDFRNLPRTGNDVRSYNGNYTCMLPEPVAQGSEMTINLFVDGSIIDVFVNDKWATSIRVFPTGADANGVEAFAESSVRVKDLKAWTINPGLAESAGIDNPFWAEFEDPDAPVDVYDIHGRCIKSRVAPDSARDGLEPGLYIIGKKKILIR